MMKMKEFKGELKFLYKELIAFLFKERLKMLLLSGVIESKCCTLCKTKELWLLLKKSVFITQSKL